jgi:Ca-activated chloride channel family protein
VPPDPETLKRMSEVSGGQAFTATESDQLDNVYEKLGSKIGQKQEKREMTAGFAGAGAALLLLAAGAAMRMGGRLP